MPEAAPVPTPAEGTPRGGVASGHGAVASAAELGGTEAASPSASGSEHHRGVGPRRQELHLEPLRGPDSWSPPSPPFALRGARLTAWIGHGDSIGMYLRPA